MLPELGVGVVYVPGLEPLIEAAPDLVSVVELEPQTLWLHDPDAEQPYRCAPGALERLQSWPQPKLVHGVGFPVGGSRPPDARATALLSTVITTLQAPWASEHLAFNRAQRDGRAFDTGFLLPPLQTAAGVAAAVRTIRAVSAQLSVPFAVETGVNYLQPRPGEISDGAFVAAVAEQADCGILLDLHNLWTNERNGRQPVREFLAEIPLERVWEVHLAGGMELNGYWLDAHSGAVPDGLLALAADVVPTLPNVRALIFEILPGSVPALGLTGVGRQLEQLWSIWNRPRIGPAPARRQPGGRSAQRATSPPTPAEWEDCLGALVVGRQPHGPLADELAGDAGLAILRQLVWDFRASMLVELLPLTLRLLFSSKGGSGTRAFLNGFFQSAPPALFGSAEAAAFGQYLARVASDMPYVQDILGFELARLRALRTGQPQIVPFTHDPLPLLQGAVVGRLPETSAAGTYELVVPPDSSDFLSTGNRPVTTG